MAYNILIVDDSLPLRSVLKKAIRAAGFPVGEFAEADGGRVALEVLGRSWIDLVLTDLNMPDMGGMELIATMGDDSALRSIPVVVISAEGGEERVRGAMQAGAAAYIHKPFTAEQIREILCRVMGVPDDEQTTDSSAGGLDF